MKKLILVTAVVAAFAFPAGALAGTFTGVVVGKSGSNIAVASKSGTVRLINARHRIDKLSQFAAVDYG